MAKLQYYFRAEKLPRTSQVLKGSDRSGSTNLLEVDRATGSSYLGPYISFVHCTSISSCRPKMNKLLDTSTFPSLNLPCPSRETKSNLRKGEFLDQNTAFALFRRFPNPKIYLNNQPIKTFLDQYS